MDISDWSKQEICQDLWLSRLDTNAKTKNFYLPPKPNGSGIGSGAIDNETSRSLDLSESGGLFLGGFSSSTISSIGGWKEAK